MMNVHLSSNLFHELDCIPSILNSCVIDDENEFLREWSILAIRNICDNNPRNQEFILQLQAQGIPDHIQQEMARKGIQLKLNNDGKVVVSQLDS